MPTTVLPLRRYTFIAGASTLLVVLVSWVAVRAVGPAQADTRVPLLVEPTTSQPATSQPGATPSAGLSAAVPTASSPSPLPSPSPSRVGSSRAPSAPASQAGGTPPVSAKPTPRRSSPPPPSPPPPSAAPAFTASYTGQAKRDHSFIAALSVTNRTGPARTWTIRLAYDHGAKVRIDNAWNAQVTRQGDTYVLTGGPLAPGATAALGFHASKRARAGTEPATCTVDGVACQVG